MKKLKEKRAALLAEAKQLLTGDEVTKEVEERVMAIHAEVDTLNNMIAAEERQAAMEASLAEVPRIETEGRTTKDEMADFRSLLKVEKRDVAYAENIYAPKGFVSDLVRTLEEKLFIRGLAKKYTLTQQEGITIPRRTVKMGAATWGNAPAADDNLAFGSVILKPQPLNGIVKLEKKLVKVAAFNIEDEIRTELADQFANTLEAAYLTGNGASDIPFGIFNTTAVPVGQDVTVGTGITAESFIAAKNKMPSGYNPVWVLHPDVLSAVEGLKDGEGRYIMTQAWRTGEPDTILGIPVMKSVHAPSATTAGSYIAALADFGAGYAIADVNTMELQILTELYAATNQIGYKGYFLTTGNVVDAGAFRRIKVGS